MFVVELKVCINIFQNLNNTMAVPQRGITGIHNTVELLAFAYAVIIPPSKSFENAALPEQN